MFYNYFVYLLRIGSIITEFFATNNSRESANLAFNSILKLSTDSFVMLSTYTGSGKLTALAHVNENGTIHSSNTVQ